MPTSLPKFYSKQLLLFPPLPQNFLLTQTLLFPVTSDLSIHSISRSLPDLSYVEKSIASLLFFSFPPPPKVMYDLALKTKNALLNRDKGKGKGNSDSDSSLILVLFFVSATTYSMCIYMKWVEKVGWMGTTTPPIMAWGRKQRVKSKRSFHLLLYKLL